ncbi:MAG: N-acetylmuramoyl-L-alanine amidase [Azospirillum sp.]|nr:N-acetylmuramoyl-L-alanine amidase [Azospirillum sp.]
MRIVDRPSPNHGPRPPGAKLDLLLVHYTGMPSLEAALGRLCDPGSGVSAHYTIGIDGTVFRHVPEERRAWHAGVGGWRGDPDVNSRSIGVELENLGHDWGYHPFSTVQIAVFRRLALEIIARHGIAGDGVIGHSDTAWARKSDPGELFDWQGLAAVGIGLWPQPEDRDRGAADPGEVSKLLRRVGYHFADDRDLAGVLTAFQRHFRPPVLTGIADADTLQRLRALARRAGG